MPTHPLQLHLRSLVDPKRADAAARFFKTGPGETGEGLRFLGLGAATLHRTAKGFRALPLGEIEHILQSEWHDERAVALLILGLQFAKADRAARTRIHRLYLAHRERVDSWALVDCSAPQLVGAYLIDRSRKLLDRLAKSKRIWDRRIAIVATQYLIRKGEFADTLRIAQLLLKDEEDLIHKAVGWMLREVGDRDRATLETFLREHYASMPRTMLRYAIEKFPEKRRKAYLAGTV